jgi:pyrroloquinoline-quinone synthase
MIQRSAPQTLALAAAIIERSGIKQNPYFSQLRSGAMPIEHLRASQEQFSFAVNYFSRAMASLVLRVPKYHRRIDILHNVWEEHGEGKHQDSHDASIRRFLESIGHTPKTFELEPMWPCTRAFNNIIAGACLIDEIEVGVCCMGNIELCFAWISNVIASAVVEKGWVARDNVHHYALHEQIDPRHAEEFFLVVEQDFADPVRRHYIQQGLELGCYAFDRFYRDLSLPSA